jgi:hypothetical protein
MVLLCMVHAFVSGSVGTSCLSAYHPLTWIVFVTVLALYSQSGGKGATHSWQSHSEKLGAISYMAVQVYEPLHRHTFRAILQRAVALQTSTFAHISSDLFLRLLPGMVLLSPDKRSLEVDTSGYAAFTELEKHSQKILLATKALATARKRGNRKVKEGGPEDVE